MYPERKTIDWDPADVVLRASVPRISVSEHRDYLLRLTEHYPAESFIKRRTIAMIEMATANYRKAVEGVGQGT